LYTKQSIGAVVVVLVVVGAVVVVLVVVGELHGPRLLIVKLNPETEPSLAQKLSLNAPGFTT
jgi:hypothetical protein